LEIFGQPEAVALAASLSKKSCWISDFVARQG
jgi:hypothetical protein